MRLALGGGRDLVRGRLFYGWYIALAGAFTSFLTFGVVGFGFGVFIEPIHEETGWSLAAISVGFSLRSFEHGLLAPVTGALVDRLGARRMAITGVLIVGVGLLLFSQARVLWVYYAREPRGRLGREPRLLDGVLGGADALVRPASEGRRWGCSPPRAARATSWCRCWRC